MQFILAANVDNRTSVESARLCEEVSCQDPKGV